MWRSRIFWQLFGASGVLVLLSVGVVGTVVTRRAEENELQQIEDGLRSRALLVDEAIRAIPEEQKNQLNNRLAAFKEELATRITLIGQDGKVLADTDEAPEKMENHANRPEVLDARDHRFGSATRRSSTLSESMMYLALRTGKNPWGVAYVRVALPLVAIEDKMADLRRLAWLAGGMTACLAVGAAFWLARQIARPIQDLTEGAEQIAAGGYGHRVQVQGADEVGKLARTFNHMSERLAAQFTQLDEDRQQLRAVLSSMVEGVVALDSEQRVLFANERAGHLLDFPTRTAVGRHFWELVRFRPLQDMVHRALQDSEMQRQEVNLTGSPPRSLVVHVGRLPGTPPRGIVLVFHDTSDLRRLEHLRQEFVANVSHELKTPLSVIAACVETLIDGAVDDLENRGRFLEQISDQAGRLQNLILDLLALARIESETEAFPLQKVVVEKVVSACLERQRPLADAKEQQLEAVPPAEVSPVAWGDEEAIRQILDNLVDNALKYTPAGGTIRVRWGKDDGQVVLQVQDTGIGIPESALPRIFERFYRVDKARSRELGGTGLGLSIVKHLVQAMQGTVSAESQVGKGTTFTVRLPACSEN